MNLLAFLEQKVTAALVAAGAPDGTPALVRVSGHARHGDYQANGVMSVARSLGKNPREMAQRVTELLDLSDVVEKTEVAGPGFINFFLKTQWLTQQLGQYIHDDRLGVPLVDKKQTVVVDLSSPNVAKEMHVAHLRSTVIGDAVARTLEFLGHKVIRANHIGDWGTQFGMLIARMEDLEAEQQVDVMDVGLANLEEFYRQAKQEYDSDPAFSERARDYVVKLQGGDDWCREQWQKLVQVTMKQNLHLYERLNVKITDKDTMGESMYNPMLPSLVADLKRKKLAVEDQGAVVVHLDEFRNKDGDPMGVIVQKRDGGFLYTTTDIACARYRVESLEADRVLYYVDARQSDHLKQAWFIARKAGYIPAQVSFEHHTFGMMLGQDNRPFRTRAGGVVKLAALLDEARSRATELVRSRDGDLSEQREEELVRALSTGAIKYADLSKNRTSDYVFDWDSMLSFEGNTAPYMMYAFTRVQSIFRKAGVDANGLSGALNLTEPEERGLAICLLRMTEVLDTVARDGTPHFLCGWLFDLAGCFMKFYESCPVTQSQVDPEVRQSRLHLCAMTARALRLGLECLGMDVVEYM
ncbi:MAG: arginine--tRNA ligase [Kistimonas sp.]|nr:arginine--tRNA ligase [Kistimonas sp.]